MSDCGCQFEAKNKAQRKVLKILFALNAAMFIVGIITGTVARSTALVADSLDMFSDAVMMSLQILG